MNSGMRFSSSSEKCRGEIGHVYSSSLCLSSQKISSQATLDGKVSQCRTHCQISYHDFQKSLFTKIIVPITSILTTICTERNEVDVAVGIGVIDAEEKRIIDVVRVLALMCCRQGSIDLVKVIA